MGTFNAMSVQELLFVSETGYPCAAQPRPELVILSALPRAKIIGMHCHAWKKTIGSLTKIYLHRQNLCNHHNQCLLCSVNIYREITAHNVNHGNTTVYNHAISPGINTSKWQGYKQEKCSQTRLVLQCSIFTLLYNKIMKDFRVTSHARLSQKPEEQREMQSENSLFSRFRIGTLPSYKVRDHIANC